VVEGNVDSSPLIPRSAFEYDTWQIPSTFHLHKSQSIETDFKGKGYED
jgi:hypothetical protein